MDAVARSSAIALKLRSDEEEIERQKKESRTEEQSERRDREKRKTAIPGLNLARSRGFDDFAIASRQSLSFSFQNSAFTTLSVAMLALQELSPI